MNSLIMLIAIILGLGAYFVAILAYLRRLNRDDDPWGKHVD